MPEDVYHQRVGDLTAFILAGGHSRRMGRNKAFLELAGRTLLDRAIELANAVTANVRIVAPQEKFLTIARTIEDVFPDCGPLGGIHAALTYTATDLNLVLAVDSPFVEADFLTYMIAQASQVSALVTVPEAGKGLQPLCAVYRRDFHEVAERALKKKKNKIDALFADVETRVIAEQEITRMGFSAQMFQNLNTPEEFVKAEQLFGERES
ncbi:MAG TPA: molybdenum cofactor guanylyltransferase [Terriglobales bacterium]|nr:molybdenum cofactor guanylyltransferase [Terriglobales bacterium]